MVADKDTNFVYFSLRLREECKDSFKKVQDILDKHFIAYGLLNDTNDIWCRDYMPIQLCKEKFTQFHYNPSYLHNNPELKSDPIKVLESNQLKAQLSDINLDGGNVVKVKDKAILTERVFKENPGLTRKEIIRSLESCLEAEIFFIPDITSDLTGHSDGHLRFVTESLLVVSELKDEFKYWIRGFEKMIRLANLDYVEIPSFHFSIKHHPENAIGCYVNYLEVGNLILFPVFELPNEKDEEAKRVINKIFPNRIIEYLNINEIAVHGGLLNCVSWTIAK